MSLFKRFFCYHRQWRKSTWEDGTIVLVSQRINKQAWTCCNCGKTIIREYNWFPINLEAGE